MATCERELFKDKIEVSLDGRQVFYLFSGGAVVAAMVFVLGVMVGKKVEARSHQAGVPGAVLDPLAALDQLDERDRNEGWLFPQALRGGEDGEKVLAAVDTALLPAKEAGRQKEREREKEKAKVQAPLRAPTAEKARVPEKAPDKPDKQDKQDKQDKLNKPEKPEKQKPEKPEKAEKRVVLLMPLAPPVIAPPRARAERAPAVTKPPAKPVKQEKPSSSAGSRFTLQLSSFQARAEAQAFFDELASAGFEPYIVEAQVVGRGTWYRVRLGRYGSYQEALTAKASFEKKQKRIAYVTRLSAK
jgi:cell division protein FtsN